jgi:protein gp37
MSVIWNLWHGCVKISEGCKNCYVFRRDALYDIDSKNVYKTQNFDLPLNRKRDKSYKIPSGEHVWTCFTSDFFIEDADDWRDDAWKMIKHRKDLTFSMATKRIDRVQQCLPNDWGSGYDNVRLLCSVENQKQAELRLPTFKKLPFVKKGIICEPLLEAINLSPFLKGEWIEQVIAGGESGDNARVCHNDWVIGIRNACVENNVSFIFKQTGTLFVKEGKSYKILRKNQSSQARKAELNFNSE